MAAIPNAVTSDGNAPGPINQYLGGISVPTSPDMFGAARARAIGEAAQSFDRVWAVGTRIVVQQQELQNETQATEQATEYTRRANEAYGQYSQLRGQNAVNGYEGFLDQLRTIREETMGTATNPAMRRMLNARVSNYETGIMAGGARYHGQQVQEAALQAQQGAAANARDNAVLFRNDEARVNQEVAAAEEAAREEGRLRGWDGGTIAARINERRGEVLGAAIRGLIDDDPIRAQELYNRNRERMDAASVIAIGNALEAPVRGRQAQNIVQGVIGGGQTARSVIFRAENAAGDDRRNPGSSASGPGQITDGMWQRYAARLGLQPNQRNERAAHEQIFDAYISDVQGRMGRQLSGQEQYAAWFLGEGAFVAFTNAAPGDDARSVYLRASGGNERLTEQAFSTNGNLMRPGMTVQQVLNGVSGRYNSAAARMGVREDGTVGRRDRATMLQEVITRTDHDPRLQAAAIAQFNQRMSVMDAAQGQERASVARDAREMDQALRTGAENISPSTLEPRVRAAFADDPQRADDIMAGLRTSEVAGQVFRSVNLATPEQIRTMQTDLQEGTGELSALLRRLRGVRVSEDGSVHPDDRAGDVVARQDMRRILAERTQARNQQLFGDRADPAQYVQQLDPTTAEASRRAQADPNDRAARADYIAASRAAQERLGVDPANVRVLTRDQSAQMAARIMQLDPAEANITQALGALRQQWGEAWPSVMQDMVRDARLPAALMIAANATSPTAQADVTRMMQWAAQNGGMEQLRAGLPTAVKTELERATSTEGDATLNNFMRSLNVTGARGAQELAVRMRESVTNLATYYARFQGMPAGQAVQQAAQHLIGDQYEFEGDFRLPRRLSNGQTLSMAQIRPAFNSVRMGLTAADLQPLENPGGRYSTEQVAERTLTSARRGMWVTNQDESGAILFRTLDNGVNVPVRRADGSPVQISFDNIPSPAPGTDMSLMFGGAGGVNPNPAAAGYTGATPRPDPGGATGAYFGGRRAPAAPAAQPAPPAAARDAIQANPERALPGAEPARTRRPSGRWLPEPPR